MIIILLIVIFYGNLVYAECVRVQDLSQQIDEDSPFWPGGVPFKKIVIADYKQGFKMHKFEMGENIGTHIDAPSHFIKDTRGIDKISPFELFGEGILMNIEDKVLKNSDYSLSVDDIKEWEEQNGEIPEGSIILINTGWWRRWVDIEMYRNTDSKKIMHFPGVSHYAADFLVSERNIKGIGIDTLSLDPGISNDFSAHKIILGAGKYIIENLGNLDKLPPKGFKIFIGVIKIREGTQAPARVLAILNCRGL